MKSPASPRLRSAPDLVVCLLSVCIVFLQIGITYYVSFQCLAMVAVLAVMSQAFHSMRGWKIFLLSYMTFTVFMLVTAIMSPLVISQNSSNNLMTVAGICLYAFVIGVMPYLKLRRAERVASVFRTVSMTTILALAGLLLLSESNLIPLLNRSAMLQQNAKLIDNYTNADGILAEEALKLLTGQPTRIDLTYGEPSFLAIVLLSCLGCFLLTSRVLASASHVPGASRLKRGFKSHNLVVLVGVLMLLYVQSLSAIIYALIVIYYAFIKSRFNGERLGLNLPLLLALVIAFAAMSYDYFMFRFTQANSLSFEQRFGLMWGLDLTDLLSGLRDPSKLPDEGIHNGVLYIVAISGIGGVLYVGTLLRCAYILAARIRASMFVVLLVMAIMMQNGGVFSPSKVVLFALVLLPLVCLHSLGAARRAIAVRVPIHA